MFDFNKWNVSEPLKLFLLRPDGEFICQLNGIEEDSASITLNLNNQYELSFDYLQYINIDGDLVESNGYHDFSVEMQILVENVGVFRMAHPPYEYDGSEEKKAITAYSIDSELQNKELVNLKINTGEKDSLEYIVEYDDDETEQLLDEYTGLPYDYIVFYNTFPEQLATLKAKYSDGVYTDEESVEELKYYCSLIPRLKHKFVTENNESTLVEYVIVDNVENSVTLQNFSTRIDELIVFYNKYRSQLSLMDIVISMVNNTDEKSTELDPRENGWSIGTIDEDLNNLRFQFSTDSTNAYSFFTQDVAMAAECMFSFNMFTLQISATLIDNIGSESGVIISRRNLMNQLNIKCNDEQLITRYSVSGGNDSDIQYYNFGSNKIDDLSYFLNARDLNGNRIYMSDELAEKYTQYIADRDRAREEYVSLTKQYNSYDKDIDELKYRVPNDIVKNDYSTFKDSELENLITVYNNALVTIITLYKEDYGTAGLNQDGSVNETYMKTTPYWYDYYAYIQALEQVEKEISDRYSSSSDDSTDDVYSDSVSWSSNWQSGSYSPDFENYNYPLLVERYKVEWSLYGTVELNAICNSLLDKLQLCIDGQSIVLKHYYKLWADMTDDEKAAYSYSESTYNTQNSTWQTLTDAQRSAYENWEDNYRYQPKKWSEMTNDEKTEFGNISTNYYYDVYNTDYVNRRGCHLYLVELQSQLDTLESEKEIVGNSRAELVNLISLDRYSHTELATLLEWDDTTPDVVFTKKENVILNRLYIDSTYSNENILTTTLDDAVSAVDIAKELYEDAAEQLSIVSQPQFIFETEIDNLLCLEEFKDYDFIPGNYIILEYFKDYYIKVRLASITFNPCIPTESLKVTFTNFVKSNASVTDLTSILKLNSGGSSGGSSGSGSSSKSSSSEDFENTISNSLISKLLNSEEFGSRITNVILDTLRVNQITAKYAKFDGLAKGTTWIDGKCIITGYIIDVNYNGNKNTGSITNTKGSIINLDTGKFNFGGGKLTYDGSTVSLNGHIETVSAEIGGWHVNSNSIYYGTEGGTTNNDNDITLMSTNVFSRVVNGTTRTNLKFAIGKNFAISKNGTAYLGGANVSGDLIANTLSAGNKTSSAIGNSGLYIDSSGNLYAGTNNNVIIYSNGNFSFGSGLLTYNGTTVSLTGNIVTTSATIGGWHVDSNSIYYGTKGNSNNNADITLMSSDVFSRTINSVTRSSLKFAIGKYFGVGTDGTAYLGNANVSGDLTANTLSAGGKTSTVSAVDGLFIDSSGNIYAGKSNQTIIYSNGQFNLCNGGFVWDGSEIRIGIWSYISLSSSGLIFKTSNNNQIASFGQYNIVMGTTESNITVSSSSISLRNTNVDVGRLGFSTFLGNSSIYGLTLKLNRSTTGGIPGFVGISADDANNQTIMRFVYVQDTATITDFTSGALNAGADIYMNGFGLYEIGKLQFGNGVVITQHTVSEVGALRCSLAFVCQYKLIMGEYDFGVYGFQVDGNGYMSGALTQGSDIKLKDNINEIDFANDFIMSLNPVTFMWKNGDHRRKRMGFIAQDVSNLCKELNENLSVVSASYKDVDGHNPNDDYFGEDVDDEILTWGISYSELIAPMVKVLQLQDARIKELESKLSS